MTQEEFNKLSDLDKLEYAIKESIEEHKKFNSEFWRGSAHMGNNILETIQKIKNLD